MASNFIIFEGPAGAGKSTYARQLSKLWHIVLTKRNRPKGIRCFVDERLPLQADFTRLVDGFHSSAEIVLLDRCWISSLIYKAFNTERWEDIDTYPSMYEVHHDLVSFTNFADSVRQEVIRREPGKFAGQVMSVTFVIMLPRPYLIEENRLKSGREYPFPAEFEYAYYSNYCRNIPKVLYKCNQTQVTIHPVRMAYRKQYQRLGHLLSWAGA
jgi:hypothetical protein